MEFCHRNFGSKFVWLTDDNFGAGNRANDLADEIIRNGTADEKTWFVQARCDDIIKEQGSVAETAKVRAHLGSSGSRKL